ncbi:MAG: hypothetical protein ACK4IX_02730 [Candidatus Sericytochromatia bacterium]
MKHFDSKFKTEIAKVIHEIESISQVEIVVVEKPTSESYRDIPFIFASILSSLVLTFFIFAPFIFGDFLILSGTIVSIPIGVVFGNLLKPQLKFFISKERMSRNVEIMARALFQKAGVHHTKEKIGVLFFCSLFEKQVYIVADRNAKKLIPNKDWDNLNESLNKIFDSSNPEQKLVDELRKFKNIFAEHIPPVENDINELPDNLEIIL